MKHILGSLALLLFVNFVFISCNKLGLCEDEELSLTCHNFLDNTLRIDGYYYGYIDTDFQGVDLYEILILYKNGMINLPGTVPFSELDSYIESISQSDQSNTKFVWGLFEVDVNDIVINHWVSAQCGYPSILRKGEILNDTTIVFREMIRYDRQGSTESEIEEMFHFKQFDIKPDSINNFID